MMMQGNRIRFWATTSLTVFLLVLASNSNSQSAVEDGGLDCSFSYRSTFADCSNRNLSHVPPNLPSSIRFLKLNGNRIKTVPMSLAAILPSLEFLDLSNNEMEILRKWEFTGLLNLKILLLNDNPLRRIEENAFGHLPSLTELSIYTNNLSCDCIAVQFAVWLRDRQAHSLARVDAFDCYDENTKTVLNLIDLDSKVVKNCKMGLRRQRRSDSTSLLAYWSCHSQKVVPLFAMAASTTDITVCKGLCADESYMYAAVVGTTCLCGSPHSTTYNAGDGCRLRCDSSKKPQSCSTIPFLDFNQLVESSLQQTPAEPSLTAADAASAAAITASTSSQNMDLQSQDQVSSDWPSFDAQNNSATESFFQQSALTASYNSMIRTQERLLTIASGIAEALSSIILETILPAETNAVSTLHLIPNVTPEPSISGTIESVVMATPKISSAVSASEASLSSSFVSTISMNISTSYSVKSVALPTPSTAESMSLNASQVGVSESQPPQAQNSSQLYRFAAGLSTVSISQSVVNWEVATPATAASSNEPTRFSSPQTRYIPSTSFAAPYTALTRSANSIPQVLMSGHRTKRAVTTSSSVLDPFTSTAASTSAAAVVFTNTSSAFANLTLTVSVSNGTGGTISYFISDNNITVVSSTLSLIGPESIAVPVNHSVEISLFFVDETEELSVQSIFNGVHSKLSLSKCSTCNPFASAGQVSQADATLDTINLNESSFALQFHGDDDLVATLSINFTFLEIMTAAPELFSPLMNYYPTFEQLFFTFTSPFRHVTANWTLHRASDGSIMKEMKSGCALDCQALSKSACNAFRSDTCFLPMTVTLTESREYVMTVNFSNPVTTEVFARNLSFRAERRISQLQINPFCDFSANIHMVKQVNVSFVGDSHLIEWKVDNTVVGFDTMGIVHTFATIGRHNVSVYVQNNLNNATTETSINVIEAGAIHGLTIRTPVNDSFYATHANITFQALLCEGENPKLAWDFESSSNYTVNSTRVYYAFSRPDAYFVQVRAENSKTVVATTGVRIYVQDIIEGFVATASQLICRVNENFRIHVGVSKGSDVKYDVTSLELSSNIFQGNVSGELRIPSPGDKNLTVTARNMVSSEDVLIQIRVEEPIDIRLASAYYIPLDTPHFLNVDKASGSHMSVKWNFGDGSTNDLSYIASAVPSMQHVYSKEGHYPVSLYAENNVTPNVTIFSVVFVERALSSGSNLFIVAAQPYVVTNSSVNVSLSVNQTSLYGYKVTCATVSNMSSVDPCSAYSWPLHLINRSRVLAFVFRSAGIFRLDFIAKNNVSQILQTITVVSEDRVSGDVIVHPLYVPLSSAGYTRLSARLTGFRPAFTWHFKGGTTLTGPNVHFNFTELGPLLVNVTAANNVSAVKTQVIVQVELLLDGLQLTANSSWLAVNTAVVVESSIKYRAEHNYTWIIDDVVISSKRDSIIRSFSTPGYHTISLRLENHLMIQSSNLTVAVQEPVSGVGVYLSDNLTAVPFNESVVLHARTERGNDLVYLWKIGSTLTLTRTAFNQVKLTESSAYNLVVSVEVFNNVSKEVATKTFPVVQRIGSVRILTKSLSGLVRDPVLFQLELESGSNFSSVWYINGQAVSSNLTLNYVFPYSGKYVIKVQIKNIIGSRFDEKTIHVFDRIAFKGLRPEVAMTNRSTLFELEESSSANASVTWHFPARVIFSSVVGLNVRLTFPEPGVYTLTVSARNPAQNTNHSFSVTVQNRVTGVGILHAKHFYRVNELASFSARISDGTNASFSWVLRSTMHRIVATENRGAFNHSLTNPGVYEISVNASNLVSSAVALVMVFVQEPTQIVSVLPPNNSILPTAVPVNLTVVAKGTNASVSFRLPAGVRRIQTFGSTVWFHADVPSNVSLVVSAANQVSNDSQDVVLYFQEKVANVSLWATTLRIPVGNHIDFRVFTKSGSHVTYRWFLNDSLIEAEVGTSLRQNFSHVGLYVVKAIARNNVSESAGSLVVSVESMTCTPPLVTIAGNKRREFFNSSWLYSEASIVSDCSTWSVNSRWLVKVANSKSDCLIDIEALASYELPPTVDLTSPLLAIQPRSFKGRFYCLFYTASYGIGGRFTIYDALFLKVLPTPPIPVITGGELRYFGQNQSFALDASQTIDPDRTPGEPSALYYRWECTVESRNSSFNAHNVGCHNTSWGRDAKLLVGAESLSRGHFYSFTLFVKRLNGSPARTSQRVKIVAANRHDVFLTCITCQAYKTRKYVRHRDMKFLGECTDCLGDWTELSVTWSVTSSNGTVVINESTNNVEFPALFIIAKDTLDGIDSYTVKFFVLTTAVGSSTMEGDSSMILIANEPPSNGTCKVHPKTGTTLETKFWFSCYNWEDQDNSDTPFVHWVRVQNEDGSWATLYRGIQANISMYLPVGPVEQQRNLRLRVLVEDALGAIATGLDRTVKVSPPVVDDIGLFLEQSVLSNIKILTEENDVNKMVALSMSSVALINDSRTVGTKEKNVISNLTQSVSRMRVSSLENVDQVSGTLKVSTALVPESSIHTSSRERLTQSLRDMVNRVADFGSQGQLAYQSTLEALFFLLQNNIVAGRDQGSTGRMRRDLTRQAPSQVKQSLNLATKLHLSILKAYLPGEAAFSVSDKYGSVYLKRAKTAVVNMAFAGNGCSFVFNHTLGNYKDVFQIFNTTHVDPYTTSDEVKTSVGSLSFLHPNGTGIPVRSLPFDRSILIELEGSPSRKRLRGLTSVIVPVHGKVEGELAVNISNGNASSLFIEILVNGGNKKDIQVFHSTKRVALDEEHFYLINASSNGVLMKHFAPGEFMTSEKHFIKIKNNGGKESMNVTILVYMASCIFWDREKGIWSSEGLALINGTNHQRTVCKSSHLTSFASTFKIAPNPIRWSTLSEIDVEKNPIAISLCLAIIVIYLMCLFFASRKDEEDRRKAQYIPFMGADDYFKYELRLKTGAFPGAGTSANVGIQIFASKHTTKPIVLAKEGSFQRNSVELFRFSSPTRLGKILRIRVWHDNSGSSPSWYLTRIVIKNLLNGQKYFFFCNRWLAVDRDDGEVERVFRVADARTMARFKTIFNDVVGRTFTDYHIWLSIFEKPRLSRFTRVQRLTCCVTFLLSWTCVDAMWYGTVRDGNVDVYIGLKGYSYEEVLVGVIASLMVFPVNFLLVLIFRNCRLPKSRRVLDGDGEVTIHVLPNSQRTRKLSEDWVEIEDFTESPLSIFGTSLPRCGGYFQLSVYQPRFNLNEGMRNNGNEVLSDHYEDEAEDSINSDGGYEKAIVTYGQRPSKSCYDPGRPSDSVSVGMDDSLASRLLGRSSYQYKKVPISYDENYGAENLRFHATGQRPSSCGASTVSTLQTRLTTVSSRNLSTAEAYESMGGASSVLSEMRGSRMKQYRSEHAIKKYSESREANDSISSSRFSTSRITSSSTVRTNFPFPKNMESIDEDFISQKIPEIRELHPNLECLLPSWFVVVGYCLCLSISIFSFVVILIYGQQFGKDKALSWLESIFAGLFQDVFVTYPVLLVLVALLIALVRKPMNLDYGDFVTCPVVPGDLSVTSEPVRGYALEIAQKQGRGKREVRRIVKNLVFQLLHLWIVFSICLAGYAPNRWIVKNSFETGMASRNKGIGSIKSINHLWNWMETEMPDFLFPAEGKNMNWALRSAVRMRQIRVHSSRCPVPFAVGAANMSKACNLEYDARELETANFSPRWASPGTSVNSPWAFVPERSMNGTKFLGRLALYPHSGYEVSLVKTKADLVKNVKELKAAGWLDVRTRAVFVEFVMQNVNINRYIVTTIAFEISASGLILPTLEMIYLRVHMYVNRLDFFRLFCEVIFGLLTFYFLWLIQDKLRRNGCAFFNKFWNLHLLFSFVVSGVVVGLSIYRLILFLELRPFLKSGVPQGYNLRYEAIIDWSIQACMGLVCFLLIFKIISLLTWTRAYRVASSTLRKAAKHLLVLSFALILVLIAFASWAYLAFGSNCYFFHSFWTSFLYTFLLRNVRRKELDPIVRESGIFIAWGILYRFVLIAFVFVLYRAALCIHLKDGRLLYKTGHKGHLEDFLKNLYNKFALRKKKSGKRVKFSLNPSVRRNTLAMSQQTISLGSDQWLSAHSLTSYSHIPSYYKERLMSRLTPSTDEILNYVYQLEHDEILEDEFYSRLESLAIETRSKRIFR